MIKNNLDNDQLLTTEELAKITGLTCRFWESRRINGDTPPYIFLSKRAVRYRWGDVNNWLSSKERKHTADQGGKNAETTLCNLS